VAKTKILLVSGFLCLLVVGVVFQNCGQLRTALGVGADQNSVGTSPFVGEAVPMVFNAGMPSYPLSVFSPPNGAGLDLVDPIEIVNLTVEPTAGMSSLGAALLQTTSPIRVRGQFVRAGNGVLFRGLEVRIFAREVNAAQNIGILSSGMCKDGRS
jgi:hypothetical protein